MTKSRGTSCGNFVVFQFVHMYCILVNTAIAAGYALILQESRVLSIDLFDNC